MLVVSSPSNLLKKIFVDLKVILPDQHFFRESPFQTTRTGNKTKRERTSFSLKKLSIKLPLLSLEDKFSFSLNYKLC
jgi:hypothetical protein